TKKESEQFVKEFFSLASEIISSGESLTIKGVGAFVPVWVEARTSVDVNTKQPIEIPGHYKLSFTPDKTMRDAVNAPFAAFTTEVVEVDMPEMVEIKEEEILDEVVELEPSDESIEIVELSEVKEEETEEVNIEDVQLEIVESEN
ncbi:MAG: HU family DNA-binding protein, partial [Paludibacteraceae bacterium]|nr:HU family DNA-binding protein [Paludibacteraceae bacterium]